MEECKKTNTPEKNGEQELDVGYVVEVSCQEKNTHEFPVTEDKQNVDMNSSEKTLPSIENKFNLIVFVGNLSQEINVAGVKELFTKHAEILDDEIVDASMLWKVKKDDKLLVFTFIEFASEHAFQTALKLNNFFQNGQNLLVLPSVQTHFGLFHMGKTVKEDGEAEKMEEKDKITENDKQEGTQKFEHEEKIRDSIEKEINMKCASNSENIPVYNKSGHVAEKIEETDKQEETQKFEHVEEIRSSTKKEKEINMKCSSNSEYIPVYKKSGHVAYLKHLPPDVTEDDVLQLFNFTRNDIVDISVLKFARGKKSNSKRSELRAVIAFPSEENLEKCLAQSHKPFRNLWVVAEKHGMAKSTLGDKRSFSPNVLNDCTETGSSPKRQALSEVSEKNTDSTDKLELDLFVKHINWNVPDRIIRDFFASVGARIQGMMQLGDPGIKGRGMCFVTMEDKESLLKGLALDGVVFLGNKIKVSIRKDRKFLLKPVEDEMPPNYSTFIAKLPVKKSAESLKSALSKFLKTADCSVKNMFIPLADNHSGNRGYAFVTFADEKSLTKALEYNDSEIQIFDISVKITVSNHWPENLKGIRDAVLKLKDQDCKRNVDGDQESSKGGKQHRRRRKGPSPHRGTVYKSQREGSRKYTMLGSSAVEYPENRQQGYSNYNSYDSDYIAYLDYLEFRDYVAKKKGYNFSDYNTRNTYQQLGSKDEFHQKQKACESYLPPVSQSYFGTTVTRTYQEPSLKSNETNRESGWRNYSSNISSRCRNDVGYNLPLTAPSSGIYDKFVQNSIPVSTQGYEKLSQTSLTSANCGYEKIVQGCTTGSTSISRDLHHTVTRPGIADTKESSIPIWVPANKRYNTDKISSTSSEWYGPDSQSCWKRRESEMLPQSTLSSGESGNRGIKLSNCSVNYASERGNSAYPSQQTSGPAHASGHSPGVQCSKSDHDVGLYSRMDRKSSSFSQGAGQNSLNSSHSGTSEGTSWHSYTAGGSSALSQTNVVYPYVEYPSSVTKRVDKQRKNEDFEKSGSFINKLVSSGILSNAGYKLSVGGYHAN